MPSLHDLCHAFSPYASTCEIVCRARGMAVRSTVAGVRSAALRSTRRDRAAMYRCMVGVYAALVGVLSLGVWCAVGEWQRPHCTSFPMTKLRSDLGVVIGRHYGD